MPRVLEGSEKEQEGEKSHYYVGLGFVCCFQQTWPVLRRAQQTKHSHLASTEGVGLAGGRGHCVQGQGWLAMRARHQQTAAFNPAAASLRLGVPGPDAGRSGSCLALQTAAFSPCPLVAVPSVHVCVLICFSYEDASHSQLRPARVNSVYLNCLFEGRTSKRSHRLRCWGNDISP